MLAYLFRCALILLSLWFARYLHWIPWSDLFNLVIVVVVPLLLVARAWRAAIRSKPAGHITADEALDAVEKRLIRRL